jgi:hypothetical protein
VLARLAATDLDFFAGRVAPEVVALFGAHRALLEQKASFVVRRLCLLLEPRLVLLSLAAVMLVEAIRVILIPQGPLDRGGIGEARAWAAAPTA